MLVAIGDDVGGQRRVEAGDARQQGHGGGVDVHPDRIHAVLHHRIQRPRQPDLVDVVLVLADADALGIDLDQFGQRVLQAAGDGYGAAQGYVDIGKFLRRQFGGRIDRGAGFGHHDLGKFQFRMALDQIGGQLVRFPAGRAVADGDQFDAVLLCQHGAGWRASLPSRDAAHADRWWPYPAACRSCPPPPP
jgi:hypothetical protein